MFQSTRRRLALWYSIVTAILLLIFASGFYGYVRLTLIDRIDDTIAHVVEVLERSLIRNINLESRLESGLSDDLDADHIDIEWFSPTGDLVWTTMPKTATLHLEIPDTSHFQPHSQLYLQPKYRTTYVNDEPVRQLTEAVVFEQKLLGYLRVSHPWFEVTKPIQQLLVDLAIGTSIMIAVVALCGWWLSGLAIAPLKEAYQLLKQFTADASHELRNPIAVIQTNVQVALADPEPNWQDHQRQLEIIERITRRLSRLLEDLLFLARQETPLKVNDQNHCDLSQILSNVVEEQQIIAQNQNITIEVLSADVPVTVLGDRSQLVRLFTNLISNAINYTLAGGKVTVSLATINSHQAQIEITDTGMGIPNEAIAQIFERFWRYQPQSKEGSGLGLAIAKTITENHLGQIKVTSSLGVGSTFTVTLPLKKN
ncbi:histidine kinase [Synechococcus sp. PCC 7502]|uniref:sensor histidine kinase n=1 Tax=Synechococcus sp. PCC 7502 TaxID=1173263 RepID=UPI00029FBF22|nr:HAMP domain-containing sensor histidine kinase [Synechococcus sp. PCC 7502]AFY73744.1 histidine kinase [Synechococcus sp. PCC 7502]